MIRFCDKLELSQTQLSQKGALSYKDISENIDYQRCANWRCAKSELAQSIYQGKFFKDIDYHICAH